MRKPLLAGSLSVSLFGALTLFAGSALAEQGTVTLGNGQTLTGDVMEVVPNDHVTLKLPGGQVKAYAWTEIGQIGIGGQIVIGGAPPSSAPPPVQPPPPAAPGPVYQPAPAAPPPYAPPPPPAARRYFYPAWNFGARLGTLSPSGNLIGQNSNTYSGTTYYDNGEKVPASRYLKTGWSLEGDIGFHFSPAWTLYGFWEHGRMGLGSSNELASGDAVTNAIGIGLNANANPRGAVGLLLDIGVGWRWLKFPTLDAAALVGTATLTGVDVLRLGIGLAIPLNEQVRLDLELRATGGVFLNHSGSCLTTDTCNTSIDSSRQGTFMTAGFRAGIRWDLR